MFGELRNGDKLGLGPGFNLISPYYYSSGRIAYKQFYGEYSSWIRCPSKLLKLMIVPDSPSLPFDPSNMFLRPYLGKGYIYRFTSMLLAALYLHLLKSGELSLYYMLGWGEVL